ncbi:uncharacterized protein METZ01_LOCUS466909, partial [marine metagenome]
MAPTLGTGAKPLLARHQLLDCCTNGINLLARAAKFRVCIQALPDPDNFKT